MAERHAGFAIVSCITQGLVNDLITAAFQNHVAPLTFRLPSPIALSPVQLVTLTGEVTVLPPNVTFTPRPDNLVGVDCRFTSELRLEGVTDEPVDVLLHFDCSLLVGLDVSVVNDRFQVGIDLSLSSVTRLDVRVVDGPSLVPSYGAVLRSGRVLAAFTAALRSIPASLLRTTIDGFPATVHIAPRQMPCGASLFELPVMFEAAFSVSRVVPRVLDGQLVMGVDIAGHTVGDPTRLASLFGQRAPVWVVTSGAEGVVEMREVAFAGKGNLSASVNPDFLISLMANTMSPATFHAFVDCHVALEGLGISFGTFAPPLRPWLQVEGARFHVGARYYLSPGRDALSRLAPGGMSIHADVTIPFSIHLQTYDGPTDFLSKRGDSWFIQVYDVDVDLPWFVSLGVVLIGMALPSFVLPVVTVFDGLLPSLLGNIANQVQKTAQSGISGAVSSFGLSAVRTTTTLPGLPNTPAELTVNRLSLTDQGMDTYVSYALTTATDNRPDRNLTVTIGGPRIRDSDTVRLGVQDADPVRCAVKVHDGVVPAKDPTVRVRWEVRRGDTGELILQQDDQLYRNAPFAIVGGPDARHIVIDRADPALMPIDQFTVYVRVYQPLSGRVKEFGSCRFTLKVEDRFDRSHPYVHWEGWAVGMPKTSAIHRTAIPGRCRMLMRAARKAKFLYLDELPFPIEEINARRDELCDYCFFGGPDKTDPLI